MNSFELTVSPRQSQYGRFASAILRVLKEAVEARVGGGQTQREIASRLDWHPSQLSRVLNGRVSNISIQTVSDLLWACDFEPREFEADPVEMLCPNAHIKAPEANFESASFYTGGSAQSYTLASVYETAA